MVRFRKLEALVLILVVGMAAVVPAIALSIQPVIIDLLTTGRRSSTVLTVENSFGTPVPVELTVHQIDMVDGVLTPREEESEDLLIFPTQAIIEPGRSQAFRVQWIGEPDIDRSHHYYVQVDQLPVELPSTQNAVQILHTFNALVSVAAPDARDSIEVVSATVEPDEAGKLRPVALVRNNGAAHTYVGRRRMTIVQKDASGRELFREDFTPAQIQERMGLGLVPGASERRLPINVELPAADGVVTIVFSESVVR